MKRNKTGLIVAALALVTMAGAPAAAKPSQPLQMTLGCVITIDSPWGEICIIGPIF